MGDECGVGCELSGMGSLMIEYCANIEFYVWPEKLSDLGFIG